MAYKKETVFQQYITKKMLQNLWSDLHSLNFSQSTKKISETKCIMVTNKFQAGLKLFIILEESLIKKKNSQIFHCLNFLPIAYSTKGWAVLHDSVSDYK